MAGLSDSAAVREALVGALRLDLIGPGAGHALARERLPGWVRPSNWYLTGFLVPRGAPVGQRGDATWTTRPRSRRTPGSATTRWKTAGPRRRGSSPRPWG